jgi:hypothetical protein
MATSLKTLTFQIHRPDGSQRSVEFESNVVKIGRIEGAQLQLDDPKVSRIHAVVEVTDGGDVRIIDLGSETGTFVNGDEVPRSKLSQGDTLQIGDTRLEIGFEDLDQRIFVDGAGHFKLKPAPEPSHDQPEPSDVQPVELENGEQVKSFEVAGFYDSVGRYIPGYYDREGDFYYGYGYFTENGRWRVRHGFYTRAGDWVDTELRVRGVTSISPERPSDEDFFQHKFFDDTGGESLEVAFLWHDHVVQVDDWEHFDVVDVGPEDDCAFMLPEEYGIEAHFDLVERRDDSDVLLFHPDKMSGLFQREGEAQTLEELVDSGIASESLRRQGWYEVALTRTDCARIEFDSFLFLLHYTEKPDIGSLLFKWREREWIPYFVGSAALHLLVMFLLLTIPDAAGSLNMDGLQSDDQFVELMVKPEQQEKKQLNDFGRRSEKAGGKHKGDEGKAGKKDAEDKDQNNEMAVKGPEDNKNPKLKKSRDKKIVQNAGAVAVIGKGEVSSIWGEGNETVGSDAKDALGNMQGEGPGAASGMGGLGVSGTGRGGGGSSEKGFGTGDLNTAGRGGTGRLGTGEPRGDLGEKKSKTPELVPGDPAVRGSLSREIIQRVVRQHRREIKYCYEMELQKHRKLQGRVKMKFTISTTGSVVAAVVEETTLNNSKVQRCMASKIRRWQFPEPKGGGIVVVRYPFNFSS